jgi:hypothetical protein
MPWRSMFNHRNACPPPRLAGVLFWESWMRGVMAWGRLCPLERNKSA